MSLNFLNLPINLFSDELSFVRAYIEKQEQLISNFIDNIEEHVELHEVEIFVQTHADGSGEMGLIDVEHIGGVSESAYNIRELFSSHMPMYQRQSMLITL